MFIGHFAVALASKRAVPQVSLGSLFLACQLADLLWPNFVLLGLETLEIDPGNTAYTPLDFVSYPYSHSLLALAGWGLAFAVLYRVWRRGAWSAAAALGALVLSHWVLDVVSHRPDMPVTLSGPERLGLGLWNSVPATIAVEMALLAFGLYLYGRATVARDRTGKVALWLLVGFLLAINAANRLGPPPPSVGAVAWAAQAVWLLVAWGYWIDRHRQPRHA